jgi:YVTN family beta-propeller protein
VAITSGKAANSGSLKRVVLGRYRRRGPELVNVAVIDPNQDYKLIKWIPTSRRPRDMKFRDYRDDDVIDVIDAKLAVVDHIPTGPSPEMFELSRDEKTLYVSNEEGSSVPEISIADKFIVREIVTGVEPEGIAVRTDGRTIYVSSEVTDMVHVIDTAAGAVTDNIVVGTRPRRFLLLPDGKELWISNELSGQVSVIDRFDRPAIGDSTSCRQGSVRSMSRPSA